MGRPRLSRADPLAAGRDPRIPLVGLLIVFACLLGLSSQAAAAERRVALVIGNGAYENITQLINPPRDAAAMSAMLRGLGFDVVEAVDLERRELTERLRDFGRKAAGADLALVFYAGHGVQIDDRNWLLPTDAKLTDRLDLEYEAISADALLRAMQAAKGRVLLLDACRDNPFRTGFLSESGARSAAASRGLARLNVEDTGTLIAFATSPGAVADDGSSGGGRNSPFTAALLATMPMPGLEIRQVLTRARQVVFAATAGRQTPWENSSLVADVYLAGMPAGPIPQQLDETFWNAIEDSREPEDFRIFLRRFPTSGFAARALERYEALSKEVADRPSGNGTPAAPTASRDCPTCPEIIRLPAGSFVMGASAEDASALDNERPAHRVEVAAFALTRYPITFDDWEACVAAAGCAGRPDDNGWGRGLRPVINVTWQDARDYARWLSARTGQDYRLPTEAEWEYAARAGTTTSRFWGDDAAKACAFANVYDRAAEKSVIVSWKPHPCSDGFVHTSPVGSLAANPWGFGDMIGNVWQWVADCWTDDYSGATEAVAVADRQCSERIIRGGSWISDPAGTRSSARARSDAGDKDNNISFRLARTLP
ncbi:SUMF1/EgtB/PvdO family nonheme iron enzyme [Aureimonas leprariae]|uniref:SUMF1/EgtB/PvdO family nonheme iron enzyme n=1 Tax=Plantimonas leprariae TaxID=2615207 RepID=A0A7V7PRH1_9HYPH|nr:SUMF1/EgtB/PvdO family nonheme iron enzyme [Aureimonas leprariae]KAB0681350.1 SUMF1/EgtB/PvdO family nonheme iron enzyme [Aureimonas leprariae]